MQIIDAHVHLTGPATAADVEQFLERSGVSAVVLLSRYDLEMRRAIGELADLAAALPGKVLPLATIDPTAPYARDILEWALRDAGMLGAKLLPTTWNPADECVHPVYGLLEEMGAPALFHTGILWLPGANANHCRPANLEVLWRHPRLRFAMAHIGWPWTDECIAVAQKFNVMRPELDQAFIDLTPGTPPSYRQDAFAKCLENVHATHMFYGSDSCIPAGNVPEGKWRKDHDLLTRLGVGQEDQQRIFSGNVLRFLGRQEGSSGAEHGLSPG